MLKAGFGRERCRQKEAKNVLRCATVFRKDPAVADTGFVKGGTLERRNVLYGQDQAEHRTFFFPPHVSHLSSL